MLGRRRRRGAAWATALVVAMAGLSGCAASAPVPSRTSSSPIPVPSPVFTSDADALAAAKKAYEAYLKISDDIAQGGGIRPERIRPYATGPGLTVALRGFRRFRDKKARSIGDTQLKTALFQSAESSGRGHVTIVIYACDDISQVDIVDEDGESLVVKGRPDLVPFQVTLTGQDDRDLKVFRRQRWLEGGVCN